MRGAAAVASILVAMKKPVSRDAKLKVPKESTGRALVNCTCGKYRSSPIKPMSLDMSLEHWSQAKVRPLQVLRCLFAASNVCSLRRVRPALYFMRSAWKRLGVKSLFGKSQPGRTLQRSLTYTLILRGIWAQCIVFQECVFFEARSLIAFHPLGTKHQASSSLIHSRSIFRVLRRGVFASNHSKAVSAL